MVESCSKKLPLPAVWASVNTFSAVSGDFAKAAETFLPLIPTTPQKAKLTEIFGNFFLFPLHGIILAISENAKNGRKKTGNLFLIPCLGVPFCMYGGYSVLSWLQFYKLEFVILVLIFQKLQNHIHKDGRNTHFLSYQCGITCLSV